MSHGAWFAICAGLSLGLALNGWFAGWFLGLALTWTILAFLEDH